MSNLFTLFKAVSTIFAVAAVFTGAQAVIDAIAFSKSFGMPLNASGSLSTRTTSRAASPMASSYAQSYVSLMGIRQLATGITLLTFAYQEKWREIATILAVIGILVAGTDGIFLARSGQRGKGVFHAVPGALIATLAIAFLYTEG